MGGLPMRSSARECGPVARKSGRDTHWLTMWLFAALAAPHPPQASRIDGSTEASASGGPPRPLRLRQIAARG